MVSLDDPKWKQMHGGYRAPYDPTPGLKRLEAGQDQAAVWEEFWNELHHQGDVGEASYAVVPQLLRIAKARQDLDWNFYALVSTIEIERGKKGNPPLPDWLKESYERAWADLLDVGIRDLKRSDDPISTRCILGALAISRGDRRLGAILSCLDESEYDELLDKYLAWSQSYTI
jgi:hypothetical protein